MKKILLFLFSIIVSSALFSQTFAPLGATWYYSTKHNMQDSLRWIKKEVVADTFFAGKNAKQFSFSYESVNALPCPSDIDTALMAKSNDSLFIYEFGMWQLLVNFNASVSDTYSITVASGNGSQLATREIKIAVDSVSQISYNGQTLRSVYLRRTNPNSTYNFYNGWYTEVIGHEFAPIPWVNSSCAFAGSYIYGIRCYADSIIGNIQFTSYACQSVTTSLREDQFSDLNIGFFPNPTAGTVFLETSAELKSIRVYNLQGQKMQEIDPKKRNWILPKEAGMYLIRLQDKRGAFHSEKIIRR